MEKLLAIFNLPVDIKVVRQSWKFWREYRNINTALQLLCQRVCVTEDKELKITGDCSASFGDNSY